MTTRELRGEVSSLCRTEISEKDLRFITYANLALKTVYSDLTVTGSYEKVLRESGESLVISMRKEVTDFGGFLLRPRGENGEILREAILIDDRIIIRGSIQGKISLIYKRLPKSIYLDSQDVRVDVPKEFEVALVLLVSYYLMMEDEVETAERFKELYTEAVGCYRKNDLEVAADGYVNLNGWA